MNKTLRFSLSSLILLSFAFTGVVHAQSAQQDTLRELLRRVDILTQELEKQKLGEAAETRVYQSKYGLGPAASQVYFKKTSGFSLAGYGEIVYQNYADRFDNDARAGVNDQIDYLRNVIYIGYKFNDRFLFNAEIEFEHAKAGEQSEGEVAMEFGYIDAQLSPALTVRAGMVLVPMGIINEAHEPVTFYGTLRPETERNIIPTTWRANGIGIIGSTESGWGYRLYFVEGLNARKFSASGLRSGRQSGSKAIAENFALTGRLEYAGVPGLTLGASFYTGNSGQGLHDGQGNALDVRTTLFSVHGVFARRGFEARGLYARARVNDAAALNGVIGLSGSDAVGERLAGGYLTLAFDLLRLTTVPDASLMAFLQYEALDTQSSVPAGFAADPARQVRNITAGLLFKPLPTIGFKLDFLDRRNDAETGLDQVNLGVSYIF